MPAATLTTLPTGSSCGSAAATPVRTVTPEAVVEPLQYAVAVNAIRDPGGGGPLSVNSFWMTLYCESKMRISYRNTNPTIKATTAMAFRQKEYARIIENGRSHQPSHDRR